MKQHGSRTRKHHLPPTPTWTCPHCQHVHTPATLRRLDSVTIQCEQCKQPFSLVPVNVSSPDLSEPPLVEIVEITRDLAVLNEEIRSRAEHSSKGRYTKHYLVRDDNGEVAFLAVDPRPDLKLMVIYEIYVPSGLRGQGIGTRTLLAAEGLAASSGFPRTRLVPQPLGYSPGPEKDAVRARLIRWYEKHGYAATQDSNFTEWQKDLNQQR